MISGFYVYILKENLFTRGDCTNKIYLSFKKSYKNLTIKYEVLSISLEKSFL